MDLDVVRANIEAALRAVRSGEKLDKELFLPVMGYLPSDDEVTAISNQLAMFSLMPLEDAANVVLQFLQSQPEGSDPLKTQKEAVEELFTAVEEKREISLKVKQDFGAISRLHERVLREAIGNKKLSREDALALIGDGRRLSQHLSGANEITVPLMFRTTDLNGMPQVMRAVDELLFQESVSVKTPGSSFQVLVTNESEHGQVAHPETDTIDWLLSTIREDSVVWDVGANIGYYALYAASIHKDVRVICFEPGVMNVGRLNANIEANRLHNRVVAFPLAMSDATGLCTFANSYFIAGGWSHRGILSEEEFKDALAKGGLSVEEAVKAFKSDDAFLSGCVTYSLDDFARQADFCPRPTHLKIDVDGPQMKVLRGAQECLARPELRHLLVELRDDEETVEASTMLAAFGFKLVGKPISGFGNRVFARVD